MQYVTTCAIILKGDHVRKGVVVELEPKVAANFGKDLVLVGDPEPEPEPEEEKAIGEMSAAELKVKAEALGLPTGGTKADLVERITLHLSGNEEGGEEEKDEDA